MGGQNEKYIKTFEDVVESLVKKGTDFSTILQTTNSKVEKLLELNFIPNNWSLLHLAVWYGNHNVVKEIIKQEKCNLNKKDQNEETPIFIAAVIDDVEMFKLLNEHKNVDLTILNRQKQDIKTFIAIHDAKACFLLLNENIAPDTPEFERMTNICKEAGSDNIAKILEKINQEKNFDIQSLSSIDVYQEKIPGGSEQEKIKRNRGATVKTNFNLENN